MPWATTLRIASWTFALLVGLTILYFGMVMGGIVPWLALPLTISGGLVALYCLWRLWKAVRARKIDAAVLTIGPEGFRDTRLSDQLIPWCDIASVASEHPGTRVFLRLALREPQRHPKRLARAGALVSSLSELSVPAEAIIAAALAHKAAP